jgi:hypothetical protein
MRPYDERPKVGTVVEALMGVQVKVPDRTAIYLEFYFEEELESSMWVGGWLWPRDAHSRAELFKLCDAHATAHGLDVEKHSDGTVYLGVYVDYREHFPHFETTMDTVIRNILELFEKIGFAEKFKDSLKK